jgi:hypothetical protein
MPGRPLARIAQAEVADNAREWRGGLGAAKLSAGARGARGQAPTKAVSAERPLVQSPRKRRLLSCQSIRREASLWGASWLRGIGEGAPHTRGQGGTTQETSNNKGNFGRNAAGTKAAQSGFVILPLRRAA